VATKTTRNKEILEVSRRLEEELERLKHKLNIGYEVEVLWLPGHRRELKGRQLKEEVQGDTILIYVEDEAEALELLRHGFLEWMLNQHSKPYRQLINKLIELFEDLQYEGKERIIEALTKLL